MADRSEQFLTVEQAARRLRVHPMTVRRHLKSGLLRGRKQGKLWRVAESALNETNNQHTTEQHTTEQHTTKASNAEPIQMEHAVSPLARAFALVEARDAKSGPVTLRIAGVNDAATELRQMREERTP